MIVQICKCGRPASHRHHKFPQHNANRKKYGKLIDKSFNIEMMCPACHTSHASIDQLWDEEQFIKELTYYVEELEEYKKVFK